MSLPLSCCNPCTTVEVTEVPGADGTSAYTLTTQSFALPAVGVQVVVSVENNQMFAVNQPVYVCDGAAAGTFSVFAIPNGNTTSLVLTFLGAPNDSPVGTSILTGAKVVPSGAPSGLTLPVSLADGGTGQANATVADLRAEILPTLQALTNLTDNTTGAASSTLAAGVGIETWVFETRLIDLTAATLINFTPGYAFKVLATAFSVEVAATTAAKSATLTAAINGVAVTDGVLSLTSANMTPVGANVAGSAVIGTNTGTAAQAFTIVGSAITAFVEGSGFIIVRVQNMDSANAFASLAAKINALQTGVGP